MAEIKLRRLVSADEPEVLEMLQDPQVMRFLAPRRALDSQEAKNWFEAEFAHPTRFTIALSATDEFVGFCGVKEIDGTLDFGYFIHRKHWGKGLASKACRAAVDALKASTDLKQVEIFIAEENVASAKVASRLGWSIIRQAEKDGERGCYYEIRI